MKKRYLAFNDQGGRRKAADSSTWRVMTPEKLKEILAANGWQFAPQHETTGVGWYAYRPLAGASDCTSNEKPPGLILKPWSLGGRGDTPPSTWRTVEFDVTGEVGGGDWVTVKVYGIAMDDAVAAIPRVTQILLAAWNAAAALNAPEAGRGDNNAAAEMPGVSTN